MVIAIPTAEMVANTDVEIAKQVDLPAFIAGADFRADCAVGQLRPTGMMPCSDEEMPRGNGWPGRGRLNDHERLCRQHRYPTGAECERRIADLDRKADAQLAMWLDTTESDWTREQARNCANWLRGQANTYRRYIARGQTSDAYGSTPAPTGDEAVGDDQECRHG